MQADELALAGEAKATLDEFQKKYSKDEDKSALAIAVSEEMKKCLNGN